MTQFKTKNPQEWVQKLRYVRTDLDVDGLREEIEAQRRAAIVQLGGDLVHVRPFAGVVEVSDFLRDEARSMMIRSIYAHGDDLQLAFPEDTYLSAHGDNEVAVRRPHELFTNVGEFKRELDAILGYVLPGHLEAHDFELRELTAKKDGHSTHRDFSTDYRLKREDGKRLVQLSTSVSIPLSCGLSNGGRAPPFEVYVPTMDGIETLVQDDPGSLMLFAPSLYHSHPPTTMMDEPYIFAIGQTFSRQGDHHE